MDRRKDDSENVDLRDRRSFIRTAASGTALFVMGGWYLLSDSASRAAAREIRADGRRRLPAGQRVLSNLKPMGGEPGDPNPRNFSLRVHGEVEAPMQLTLAQLLSMGTVDQKTDVHCVTGWSVLGATFTGVPLLQLADMARVKKSARHVVFESAHGYTANVPLREALAPNVLITHKMNGKPLSRAHGGPVRSLVPDLYFWKSAKYLTGVRFVSRDEPGHWETRGYHNHADPWREERYS